MRPLLRTRLSIPALAAVVAAGCGGSSEDGAASGPSVEELPALLAESVCDVANECLGSVADLFFGGQSCSERIDKELASGELALLERALDRGSAVYHPDRVQACLDAVDALGCDLFDQRFVTFCGDVIEGTVAEGGDCAVSAECEGERFCDMSDSCPGTCRALLAAGQACADDDQCQEGLQCSEDTGRCAATAGEGEACEGGSMPACRLGLFCAGGDEATPGTCRATEDVFAAAEGASCDFTTGDLCASGAFCAAVGVTADGMGLVLECEGPAPSGGACRVAIPDMCPAGQYCDVAEGSLEGTCTALPGRGEPCGRGVSEEPQACAVGTVCVEGTCRPVQENGGACEADEACFSGVCLDGACVPTLCSDAI